MKRNRQMPSGQAFLGCRAARPLHPAWICVLVSFFILAGTAFADGLRDSLFTHRAESAFVHAQARYRSQMDDPAIAVDFARACYDWADWATNKAQRANIARKGIAACQQSLLFTNAAAGHYYMAMNLGQLARTETLGALKVVRQIERQFLMAADLDPREDFAGAERGLGLLYRDAPGWPLSIGNRSRAQSYLQGAVALAPNDPENVLNLAESELKWGKKMAAKKEMAALDALWSAAQKSFTGPAW
ncbi:MAG: hypothetical protein ACRED1_09015, partial [Limisphaerales bacterium]